MLAIILLLYPYFYRAYPNDTFSYLLKALISLPLIFFIPGYVMFNAFVKNHDLSFLEVMFIQILGSILISGWIGLILAELGYFSLLNLILILIILCGFLGWKFKIGINLKSSHRANVNHVSIFLLIIVIIGIILFFQPMITNFKLDSGIIVSHSVNIAKTGSIIAQDPIMDSLSETIKSIFYQSYHTAECNYLQFPKCGFYVDVDNENIIRFQYFDLFPILLAISYSLFSIENFLYINSFIAILSILCIFILARRIFNIHVAVLSSLLLTINFAQIFFAKHPGAEILTQLLIFGGIFAIMLLIKTNNPFYGILGAFAFSGCLITRVDSLLLYFPIIVLLFLLILTETFRREHLFFFVPFLILNIHVWLHVYFFDLPYFIDMFRVTGYEISYLTYSLLLITILSIVIFISVLLRKYRYNIRLIISPLRSRTKTLKLANSIFLVSVFVFLYFIRPQLDPNISTGGTILLLEQALTFVGLLLATYGLIKLINIYIFSTVNSEKERITACFFLLVGISYTVFYLISLKNQVIQYWLFRRYITVTIPFLIILMSYGLTRIGAEEVKREKRIIKAISYILIVFLISSFLIASFPLAILPCEDFILENKKLASEFSDADIIIFPHWHYVNFGIVLKYIFDKDAIVLPDNSPLLYPDHKITNQIEQWKDKGKNVYLVDPSLNFLNNYELICELSINYNIICELAHKDILIYTQSLCIFKVNNTEYRYKYLLISNKPPSIYLKCGSISSLAKIVQFQHPTSQIQHDVLIPQNSKLKFSIALDPCVWSPEKGDGVLFEIYIKEKDSEKLLFSKYINPKNNPEDRKWNDFEVGLSQWENENVTIIFTTSPGPNNDSTYDWAWWGEPMIVSK